MNTPLMDDWEHRRQETHFWGTVGTAIAGLAKRAGCSARECPLPEIREAARDLDEWPPLPPSRTPDKHRAAA
jgi:hypothetical protein